MSNKNTILAYILLLFICCVPASTQASSVLDDPTTISIKTLGALMAIAGAVDLKYCRTAKQAGLGLGATTIGIYAIAHGEKISNTLPTMPLVRRSIFGFLALGCLGNALVPQKKTVPIFRILYATAGFTLASFALG